MHSKRATSSVEKGNETVWGWITWRQNRFSKVPLGLAICQRRIPRIYEDPFRILVPWHGVCRMSLPELLLKPTKPVTQLGWQCSFWENLLRLAHIARFFSWEKRTERFPSAFRFLEAKSSATMLVNKRKMEDFSNSLKFLIWILLWPTLFIFYILCFKNCRNIFTSMRLKNNEREIGISCQ